MVRFNSKISRFNLKKDPNSGNYLLTEISNTKPNNGHTDVFIYHVLHFEHGKLNVRKILNRILVVMVMFSCLGKFHTESSAAKKNG